MTKTTLPRKQRGNILISIMVIMFTSLLIVGTLIDEYIVTEAQTQDEELARLRIHWAIMGQVDYFFSQARREWVNCGADDNCKTAVATTFFNDFNRKYDSNCANVSSYQAECRNLLDAYNLANTSGTRTWPPTSAYADTPLTFTIQSTLPSIDPDSGARLAFEVTINTPSTLEDLDTRIQYYIFEASMAVASSPDPGAITIDKYYRSTTLTP